jgi:hypothetical protein
MHHSHVSRVARALFGALPLTLVLTMACEGPAPRTIGGYCRRDTDCVSGLRCLNLACTEPRQIDGGVLDHGTPADAGNEDVGTQDAGTEDTGVDLGPEDQGPEDTGVDLGPEDMGADLGQDMG